jgi:CO/xanthine dehydrogenase FAD-binding subunit
MSLALPTNLDEALAMVGDDPATTVLAGGTDLMVELNYGHRRPASITALRRVDELRGWRALPDGGLWLGARLTYREMETGELAGRLPALAQAARTVGSPQIRNTGTLGGNLATASPAGDTLPVLASLQATVELASVGGRRTLPLTAFLTGPKRTARRPDELVTGVTVVPPAGPQEFLKIGTRNAMVIAVANCALVVDPAARQLRCTLGSVGPVPIRCEEAEAWFAAEATWDADADGAGDRDGEAGGPRVGDPTAVAAEFGRRCAAAARPIDDHRSTAAYRRHACAVLARRALARALGAAG